MAQFRVTDLLINVISENGGGAQLCADTSATVPTPITPWVLVAAHTPLLERVQAVGRKFAEVGDPDGSPGLVKAIEEVGRDLGRAVAVNAFVGGGVGYPDPNCGGSSLETIPTPITPVVHKNLEVLQPRHLPGLKTQLAAALESTSAAEESLVAATAKQAGFVRKKLEGALARLG